MQRVHNGFKGLKKLMPLTDLGIFAKVGGAGQSAHYIITKAKPTIGK